MTIFVDMDGVLADFDQHYENVFGVLPRRVADNVDWKQVRVAKNFFRDLPPMKDLDELWAFLEPFKPIVLTGIPSLKHDIVDAADNKRAWASKYLGPDVEVRCVLSKEKYLHAAPGDILIDDWEKYQDLWLAQGGQWVTHTSAASTIAQLKKLIPTV